MKPHTLRSSSIFAGLACAGLALISWSQPWYSATLNGLFAEHPALEVGGDVSAPAVAALALASAAGFAAMAISGRFFRTLLGLLQVALGACIVLSASLAIASPISTVTPAVTVATSVAGAGPVRALLDSVSVTAWPFIALCSGAFLALVAIGIVATGRRWPGSAKRYEPVMLEGADPSDITAGDAAVSNWDALSGGSDPTSS